MTTLICVVTLLIVSTIMGLTLASGTSSNTAYAATPVQRHTASHLSAFVFTPLVGTTNVSVRLVDRTVTRADIPSNVVINGTEHTVTEVAMNGFASVPSLEVVRLPSTVTRIGNSAFMNNPNLRRISIPGVVDIGANAFAMSPRLADLILPDTVNTIGVGIVRNNNTQIYSRLSAPRAGWNAGWNMANSNQNVMWGDEEFFYPAETSVTPFNPLTRTATHVVLEMAFYSEQNSGVNIVVPYYVDEIGFFAFEGNEFYSLTVEHSASPIKVGFGAFSSTQGQVIDINRHIIFEDSVFWNGRISICFC